jgi:hypothetical protein
MLKLAAGTRDPERRARTNLRHAVEPPRGATVANDARRAMFPIIDHIALCDRRGSMQDLQAARDDDALTGDESALIRTAWEEGRRSAIAKIRGRTD